MLLWSSKSLSRRLQRKLKEIQDVYRMYRNISFHLPVIGCWIVSSFRWLSLLCQHVNWYLVLFFLQTLNVNHSFPSQPVFRNSEEDSGFRAARSEAIVQTEDRQQREEIYCIYVGDFPTCTSSVTPDCRIHFFSTQTCVFKLLPPCYVSSSAVVSVFIYLFFFTLRSMWCSPRCRVAQHQQKLLVCSAWHFHSQSHPDSGLAESCKISEEDKRNSFSSPEAIGRHCCEMSLQLKRAEYNVSALFMLFCKWKGKNGMVGVCFFYQ